MTDLRNMSAFRDIQVAMDFQQMAENGYLDVEFTMCGTIYYQNGERHYLVSAEEEKIIDFIEHAVFSDLYPLPIETLTEICPVSLGEKENIAQAVKMRLARKLQEDYPLAFMQILAHYAAMPATDAARPLLEAVYKDVRNAFAPDLLLLATQLVQLAYSHKVLRKDSCQNLLAQLDYEWENLQDDVCAKDILEKTWYTLTYRNESGHLKRLTNARLPWIYHKKYALEKDGYLTAPIFKHTYWYNSQTVQEEIKMKHQTYCESILDENYFQQILMINSYPSAIDKAAFLADLEMVHQNYGEKAAEAMTYYGRLWHIFS